MKPERRVVAVGAILVLVAGPGRAAPPRPEREAALGEKRSVAPDAALGGSLEAKKPAAGPAAPALDFESFRRGVEFNISGKRREEIQSLQKLIQLGGGSDEETPQWYFRLAELFWEESQYFFFEANRRDEKLIAMGTRGDPREIDRLTAEKKDFEGQQNKLQIQAVALYKAIIQRFPKYPRLDEVLYFLAQNLQKRDRNDQEALKAYRALIQRYPKSPFVPDSWMAFGEYYFERANKNDRNENLTRALESYKHAAEFQESSVYGYALYKQGWVHYNLGNWNEALELFRAVIFFGEMPTSTVAQDRKIALVKEARKDYVRTYSHVGSAERAYDEFKRVGGEGGWWEMLKSLASLYFDEGKDRDAILVYARLIREKPLSVEAPFFQSHIVTCVARLGRKDAAVQQAHAFVKMLRDIEASPDGKDPKNARYIKDARQDAERTLRVLAVQYHNEWKKTRDQPVAGFAAEIYRDYLDVFPDELPAYDMRFFHAELLYALEGYEEAGAEYERVALSDVKLLEAKPDGAPPPAPDPKASPADAKAAAEARGPGKAGKYFKDALESTVYAYDLVVKKLEQGGQKVAPGDPKKRIPMALQRQKLVDACERYLKYQPKGDKWVEVAYMAAQLYYQHNSFGEASDLFTRIVLDHPTHQLAFFSANLVLDAYNQLGDWRNVSGWAKRFYANKPLLEANPKLKEDLTRIIEQSAFKVIEEREQVKDWEGATDEYLAFARDWPASKLAPTALYNASVDQVRAGRLDRAMEIRDQFLSRHADHELAAACLFDNAEAYEAIGDFAEAADRYERYFLEWRRAARGEPVAAARPVKGKGKLRGARARARVAAAPAPAADAKKPAYDEKKAIDAIINAALFRNGLRDWARAEADSQAYLDAWPDGPDAPRLFLSIADLYEKRGQTQKELGQLEEYQQKYAKDPDEWLSIQERMAKRFGKLGNAGMTRRLYDQGLAYYRQHASKVDDRGLALVAQAQYLELEPEFVAYDRFGLNVLQRDLPGRLKQKAQKMLRLEAEYGKIVKMKQPEPAICALNRIGQGYQHYAQALYDNPIPKNIRANKEYLAEYKAQIAQLVEQLGLEKKAAEFFGAAVSASRDYGVNNACAKEALAAVQRAKPDEFGPSPEVLPPVAAVATAERPAGYGLIGDVLTQAAPRPPATPRKGEAALPILKQPPAAPPSGKAGGTKGAAREGKGDSRPETGATNDPQRRTPDADQPVPVRKKKAADDDEDLLP